MAFTKAELNQFSARPGSACLLLQTPECNRGEPFKGPEECRNLWAACGDGSGEADCPNKATCSWGQCQALPGLCCTFNLNTWPLVLHAVRGCLQSHWMWSSEVAALISLVREGCHDCDRQLHLLPPAVATQQPWSSLSVRRCASSPVSIHPVPQQGSPTAAPVPLQLCSPTRGSTAMLAFHL